jgi:hypothetical protein
VYDGEQRRDEKTALNQLNQESEAEVIDAEVEGCEVENLLKIARKEEGCQGENPKKLVTKLELLNLLSQ